MDLPHCSELRQECGAGFIPGWILLRRELLVATYGYNQCNFTTSKIANSSYHAAFNRVTRAANQTKPKSGIVEEWHPIDDKCGHFIVMI